MHSIISQPSERLERTTLSSGGFANSTGENQKKFCVELRRSRHHTTLKSLANHCLVGYLKINALEDRISSKSINHRSFYPTARPQKNANLPPSSLEGASYSSGHPLLDRRVRSRPSRCGLFWCVCLEYRNRSIHL